MQPQPLNIRSIQTARGFGRGLKTLRCTNALLDAAQFRGTQIGPVPAASNLCRTQAGQHKPVEHERLPLADDGHGRFRRMTPVNRRPAAGSSPMPLCQWTQVLFSGYSVPPTPKASAALQMISVRIDGRGLQSS